LHSASGTIYRMASDLFTDADGEILRRMRTPPILADEQKRLFIDRLQLHLEPGLGLTTGQGSDPQVLMRMSKTGGKIFGNQRARSAGVQGDYGQRLVWHNCGSGRNMVPELVATDPVAWRWLDLIADVRRAAA